MNSLGLGTVAGMVATKAIPTMLGSTTGFFGLVGGMLSKGSDSLRHARQQAALKAVLNAIASEHNIQPDVLQMALGKLLAEMLDQGVSQEELLDLLSES